MFLWDNEWDSEEKFCSYKYSRFAEHLKHCKWKSSQAEWSMFTHPDIIKCHQEAEEFKESWNQCRQTFRQHSDDYKWERKKLEGKFSY